MKKMGVDINRFPNGNILRVCPSEFGGKVLPLRTVEFA
jgi:hypothetical protein